MKQSKPTLSCDWVKNVCMGGQGHIATTSAEREVTWSQIVSFSQAILAFVPPHLCLLLAVHVAVEAYA